MTEQVETQRDKPPRKTPVPDTRIKPPRPLTPRPPTPIIKTEIPMLQLPENKDDEEVGTAINRTSTKKYDKLIYDDSSSDGDDNDENYTEVSLETITATLMTTNNENKDEPNESIPTQIKDKIINVTQNALNDTKDEIEGLLSNKKKLKKKATVGGIGSLIILALTILLIIVVKKI